MIHQGIEAAGLTGCLFFVYCYSNLEGGTL